MNEEAQGEARLEVVPTVVPEGNMLTIAGSGWPGCPILIEIDGEGRRFHDILRGSPLGRAVRPDGFGSFLVQLGTRGLRAGKHEVVASVQERGVSAGTSFELSERPLLRPDGKVAEGSYWRVRHFFDRRFGHIGFVPPGIRDVQIDGIRRLRAEQRRTGQPPQGPPEPGPPTPMSCNWNPVGPSAVPHAQTAGTPTQAVSGRALSLAIDPTATSTVLLGTAGAGIWKTTDGGTTWSPKSDFRISLAIGAIAFDPTNHLHVLAGTGEYHEGSIGGLTYYGKGVLRSTDGGETWNEHAGANFDRHEISRIVFDPTDATGQRVYLSASNGVFESLDNGQTWNSLLAGSASDLVAFEPTGPPNRLTLIAGVYGSGLWTSTRDAGVWGAWTQITDPAFPATFARIALGQCTGTPRTIYALFAYGGFEKLVKTTNGGNSWSEATVRLDTNALGQTGVGGPDNHFHYFTVPAADLTAVPAAHAHTTSSAGTPSHTHTISLTAQQIAKLASGGVAVGTTDPDGTGHQHTYAIGTTRSCDYNLHVSVKPDDANTIFLGEVNLWRNTSGGGVFEDVTDGSGAPPPGVPYGIHVDQHAFAFDPTTPSRVWAGNDGGAYRSQDGGNTWEHRNQDLQTLQYLSVAQHPTREAVMLGGTQDNGTHRYGGHPSWTFSAGGDGGFAHIDPSVPTRMYRGTTGNSFGRNDAAGALGSWVPKTGGVTGPCEFYPPFELDPSDPNVCYFGNAQLWRSPDNADSWTAITNALTGNATAIAGHPTDATTVFVGTNQGHVYRVQRTGVDWTLPNVTTTDLSAPPLPVGLYISDIAVDTAGNVWVTFASVTWTEANGEFTSEHVFRRDAASGIWEARVTGLLQANPVNSIVIDPTNESRLFIGADVGVFRTEMAGTSWTLWDDGLPNVPVFDLRIGPLRLLRAGTHGRGVWERPIDALMCPLVDLYVRDNVLDTGRVVPSYDGVASALDPTSFVHHWQSPDIKVDAMDPSYQTPAPVTSYVVFEADLQHETARRTVPNRFYVQVHNRGVNSASNVQVRGFFAAAGGALPPLPADFWSSGKPFVGTPSGPDWTPVGSTATIPVLEPAEPGLVSWEWTIPMSAPKHSCLLAVTTCAEDPVNGAGIFNPDTLVLSRKQVALKNLHVENAVMGPMPPEDPITVEMHDMTRAGALYGLELWWGTLPGNARVFVAFERLPGEKPPVTLSAEELRRVGIKRSREGRDLFLEKYEFGCDGEHVFDLGRVYELSRPKDARNRFFGIRVPAKRLLAVAVNVVLPDRLETDAQFDLVQRAAPKRAVGGSTYVLRAQGGDQKPTPEPGHSPDE
jgi:photosystem II stability/assembly factor-like uncharacterized protein